MIDNFELKEEVNYDFYSSKMPQNEFNIVTAIDPTPNKAYSKWLLAKWLSSPNERNYIENNSKDITYAIELHAKYKKYNVLPPEAKDVMKFKTTNEFEVYMDENKEDFEERLISKSDSGKKEYKVYYKDKNVILLTPLTWEASKKWRNGATWCTGRSDSDHYFKLYTNDGTLYIVRYFQEDGRLDMETGYQLYIPGDNPEQMDDVEFNDLRNQTADFEEIFNQYNLKIPQEILDPIIEKYNEKKESKEAYYVIGTVTDYDKVGDDSLELTYSFSLDKYEDGYIDSEGYKSAIVSLTKLNSETDDEFYEDMLINSEYDFTKGRGIYIDCENNELPEDVENEATNEWHQAEYYGVEDYEARGGVKRFLESYPLDFIVLTDERILSDTYIDRALSPYMRGIEELYHEMGDGTTYYYYCFNGFNPETDAEAPPVSTPFQRKRDKQNNLPYGL